LAWGLLCLENIACACHERRMGRGRATWQDPTLLEFLFGLEVVGVLLVVAHLLLRLVASGRLELDRYLTILLYRHLLGVDLLRRLVVNLLGLLETGLTLVIRYLEVLLLLLLLNRVSLGHVSVLIVHLTLLQTRHLLLHLRVLLNLLVIPHRRST